MLFLLFLLLQIPFAVSAIKVIHLIAGAGSPGSSGDGGQATSALLNNPFVSVWYSGNLFIADAANNKIRKVDLTTGIITTYAGTGTAGFSGDNGQATSAKLNNPQG